MLLAAVAMWRDLTSDPDHRAIDSDLVPALP